MTTPSIDLGHGRLALRYLSNGRFHLALYDLADVRSGGRTPLADFVCPPDLGTFQGWATWGSYVYFYTGNNYSDKNPPPGNAWLFCYDWNTGREVQRIRTEVFARQHWREPEGMAVRAVDGSAQLVFGFSSQGNGVNRRVISLAEIGRTVP